MYVHARVRAGAKKEGLEILSDTQFRIAVREKAERNQANRRVCALLAAHFRVPLRAIKIINGHHGTSKVLSVVVGDKKE